MFVQFSTLFTIVLAASSVVAISINPDINRVPVHRRADTPSKLAARGLPNSERLKRGLPLKTRTLASSAYQLAPRSAPSSAPHAPPSKREPGYIGIYDEKDEHIGYFGKWNEFGEYIPCDKNAPVEERLRVEMDVQKAETDVTHIYTMNGAHDDLQALGVVYGYHASSLTLGETDSYTYFCDTEKTEAHKPAVQCDNAFTRATSFKQKASSQVWARKEKYLDIQVINPDGNQCPKTTVAITEGVLVMTASLKVFKEHYDGETQAVKLKFEPSNSN